MEKIEISSISLLQTVWKILNWSIHHLHTNSLLPFKIRTWGREEGPGEFAFLLQVLSSLNVCLHIACTSKWCPTLLSKLLSHFYSEQMAQDINYFHFNQLTRTRGNRNRMNHEFQAWKWCRTANEILTSGKIKNHMRRRHEYTHTLLVWLQSWINISKREKL